MSTTQLYKTPVPADILWLFLQTNGIEKEGGYLLFSKAQYKKALLLKTIEPFLLILEPYYHESKKHYIKRKMDYSHFTTILRQLCNFQKATFQTKLVYDKSTYTIDYYFQKVYI
jgi:hypothetical protein